MSLRILAGEARGRLIKSPPEHMGSRPILGRMKKSLFDILQPRLPQSSFLDLFAGTGSVGLEALSRGASQAVFIERHSLCYRLLKENLAALGYESSAQVLCGDVFHLLENWESPFDLIFLGPPYVTPEKKPALLTEPALALLARRAVLRPGGWIVSQHHAKEKIDWPLDFMVTREESYGDSTLTFLTLADNH